MQAVRYRQGINATTGKALVGRSHLAQSLAVIWMTRLDELVMLLPFGSELRSRLSEDVTGELALDIYNDLTTAAERWEPEYRVREMQFVRLTRDGGLGLRHAGRYYPEGRLGNYEVFEDFGATASLTNYEAARRRRLGLAA